MIGTAEEAYIVTVPKYVIEELNLGAVKVVTGEETDS